MRPPERRDAPPSPMAPPAPLALRRIPHAWDGLTGVLFAASVVGPRTMDLFWLDAPRPAPLAIAAGLQFVFAIRHKGSLRALVASVGLVLALTAWLGADWP